MSSVKGIVNKDDPTVLLMQDKFVQMYKGLLAKTEDRNQARSLTIDAMNAQLNVPGAITKDGKFAAIVEQEKRFARRGTSTLEAYKEGLKAIQKPEIRNNPVALANSLGAGFVYTAYDDMKAGKPASQPVKNLAALMGMTPLDFVNYVSRGARNSSMPPITVSPQIEKIRENMKPLTRRLYTNPTNERIIRANIS